MCCFIQRRISFVYSARTVVSIGRFATVYRKDMRFALLKAKGLSGRDTTAKEGNMDSIFCIHVYDSSQAAPADSLEFKFSLVNFVALMK
jgi:hypothetical protein